MGNSTRAWVSLVCLVVGASLHGCGGDPVTSEADAVLCSNGRDDDGDGLVDCAEPACSLFVFCTGSDGGTDGGGSDGGGSDGGGADGGGGSDGGGADGGVEDAGEGDGGCEPCDDGLACNGVETCGAGGCVPGTPAADVDDDGDGFTPGTGDCDDCDPLVTPASVEIASGGVDDDCDGVVDEALATCDTGLALTSTNPADAALALDVCIDSAGRPLVSAAWRRAAGGPALLGEQAGLQGTFGTIAPVVGSSMVALSTGRARTPGQPGACGAHGCTGTGAGSPPPGFPADIGGCAATSPNIFDDAALEVTLVAPANAIGVRVRHRMFLFEYPEWVCTAYTDQFVILVDPIPTGASGGNVAFDSSDNPMGSSSDFLTVCSGCADGTADLASTGFDVWNDAGATPWLETTFPVVPGATFTMRFAVWDGGDQGYDSTVLLDGLEWITGTGPVVVSTQRAP